MAQRQQFIDQFMAQAEQAAHTVADIGHRIGQRRRGAALRHLRGQGGQFVGQFGRALVVVAAVIFALVVSTVPDVARVARGGHDPDALCRAAGL